VVKKLSIILALTLSSGALAADAPATAPSSPAGPSRETSLGETRNRETAPPETAPLRETSSRETSSRETASRDSAARSPSYSDRYSILSERNIFLRDRRRHVAAPTTRAAQPRTPEQSYALTGVVYEPFDDKAYAFFEQIPSGSVLRLEVGDTLAHGRIVGIGLDAVAYESNGKQVFVDVGCDLTGARAVMAGASRPALGGSSSAPTSSAPPIDPNNPNLTLEQRMRLRAQQERGRAAGEAAAPTSAPAPSGP
jgi:hypothetical protein